jgi:ABC-type sugar transport system permease subunit
MARQTTQRLSGQGRAQPLGTLAKYWRDYLCISPLYILFVVFTLFPVCWAFYLSFHRWDGIRTPQWVGLDNYQFMLTDIATRDALRNTLIYIVLLVPLGILVPFVLAVLLNLSFLRLRGLFRTLIFLPAVTSMVIVGIVFRFIFDDAFGWLNGLLALVDLGPFPWTRGLGWSYIPILALTIWIAMGFSTLTVLGGLQGIDPEIYEAARIDGATEQQIFWRITIPLMRPVMLFLTVGSINAAIVMFIQPTLLTGGGPDRTTLTPVMVILQASLSGGRFGDTAALSFALSLIVILVTAVQLYATRSRD